MALTPSWLDELRARTPLSALIGKSVKVSRAGREFKACCPFHNEKTPSFTINDEKAFAHCFGCGWHGDAIKWMTDHRGLSFMDAIKELAATAGMEVPAADPRAAARIEQAVSLRDVTEASANWFRERLADSEGNEARSYLANRNLTPQTIANFGLGYAPDARGRLREVLSKFGDTLAVEAGMLIQPPDDAPANRKEPYDRFRGRLMIPIRDARGRTIAFGGRILGLGEPKYLNSPDTPLFDKGSILYNLDRAAPAARKADRLIIVEGYMDVIALAQAGIDEAVAPLGTALTEAQIKLAWRQVPAPILAFDGDAAGQRAAKKAIDRALPDLSPGYGLKVLTLPLGMDPDDIVSSAGRLGFEKCVAEALPTSEFLYRSLENEHETSGPEGRSALKAALIEKSQLIQNKDVRGEFRSWFLERFYDSFGWKAKNKEMIYSSVIETGEVRNARLFQSVYRSALFGLAQRPAIASRYMEEVSAMQLKSRPLLEWRDAILEQVIVNHETSEDCIAQISEQGGSSVRRGFDLSRDLLFPWNHDKSKIDTILPRALSLLVEESVVLKELESINADIVADAELERYESLHQHRLLRWRRRDEVRDLMAALSSDELPIETRWAA